MYIYYDKTRINVPENWNQLTRKQLVRLTALLHKGLHEDVVALEALRILWSKTKLRFYGIMRLWKPKVWDDLKVRALEHITWIFEKEIVLTEQLLAKYKGLYGPAAEFNNLKMIEFHACEVYYHRYISDKDIVWLNRLVAVLYRPAKEGSFKTFLGIKTGQDHRKTAGDIRQPFDEYISGYYSDKISKWNMAVRQSILTWYDGNRQMLIKFNQDVFSGKSDSKSNIADGMYGVIRAIAQSQIHGDFDKVSEMNVHKAVMEMRKSIEEYQEQERQLKAQTK
jgi:hypothetical protein